MTWNEGRERFRDVVVHGLAPVPAAVIGSLMAGLFAAAVVVFEDGLGRPAQAVILVVPVVVTAALGGRRPALVVTVVATFVFSLVMPPRGSPLVRVADDVVALIVFTLVALMIGGLVAARVDALEQVERQRRALLRAVSHDLRTPLSAIVAAGSEARDAAWVDDAARHDLLDVVVDEGMRLDRLVANLLSMARIEAGALVPQMRPVDLGELVAHATARLTRVAARRDVTLDVAADPRAPQVQGDHTLLEQVTANLVENAIRHAPAGSAVVVRVCPAEAGARLSVGDAGPGVSPTEAATIFEPFRRGPNAGMTGIGLAICRAVVDAHGGTISAGERAAGGAEFTVTLPVR
jgi:K+-sensing histidine kinase KdpD